jgi:hypothetical protein
VKNISPNIANPSTTKHNTQSSTGNGSFFWIQNTDRENSDQSKAVDSEEQDESEHDEVGGKESEDDDEGEDECKED